LEERGDEGRSFRSRTVVSQTVDGERTTIVIEDGEIVEHRTGPADEPDEATEELTEELRQRLDEMRRRLHDRDG
jgi:hypothetical protein